eukprot:gene4074-biopygen3228
MCALLHYATRRTEFAFDWARRVVTLRRISALSCCAAGYDVAAADVVGVVPNDVGSNSETHRTLSLRIAVPSSRCDNGDSGLCPLSGDEDIALCRSAVFDAAEEHALWSTYIARFKAS